MAINLENIKNTVKAGKLNMLLNSTGKLTVSSLLSSNTKLEKGEGFTTGLTLVPFKTLNSFYSGAAVNFCENGSSCFKTCLFNQSGRFYIKPAGQQYSKVQLAGVKRALLFMVNPKKFERILIAELALKLAELEDNEKLYVRLNVMSDIDFTVLKQKITDTFDGQIVVYDYTKVPAYLSNNINMALSVFNSGLSLQDIKLVKQTNSKLSIIVDQDTQEQLLAEYPEYCFDGDQHDLFFKENGLITLLSPKGISNKQKEDLQKHMTTSKDTVVSIIKAYQSLDQII